MFLVLSSELFRIPGKNKTKYRAKCRQESKGEIYFLKSFYLISATSRTLNQLYLNPQRKQKKPRVFLVAGIIQAIL